MKIYISHSSGFDYQNELYKPLMESPLYSEHEIILPHANSQDQYPSKQALQEDVDLMIAEVSYPSTGLGIELGWADAYDCKIIAIHKEGSKVSGSLGAVTKEVYSYQSEEEMVNLLQDLLS